MKKLVVKIILVILIITLGSKAYYFMVMNHICRAIERFENEENRYYSVVTKNNEKYNKKEILGKNNIIKSNELEDGQDRYCEWEDFSTNKRYLINLKDKKFEEGVLLRKNQNYISNLPELILNIYKNDKLSTEEVSKIKYIVPIKYENQKCYKIMTDGEIIIVNRSTFLPIHSFVKITNSNGDYTYMIEKSYEFKVNEVTDEEIELPDLTGYTKTNE